MKKTPSEAKMGNQNARKKDKIVLKTNKDRLRGALWVALNVSSSNEEIFEIMHILGEGYGIAKNEEYFRSKHKGIREQAIEDIKAFI